MIYYPVLQNVKKILVDLHLLLTHGVAHKAVITNVPIIGFKNDRSRIDHLVWLCYPRLMREEDCGENVLVRYIDQ